MQPNLQLQLSNEWVTLRPLQEDDFENLFEVASDPLLWEQHPNPDRYKREVFQNYFKGALESKGALLITSSITGKVIGCSRYYDWVEMDSEIKIGYTFFARECWGKPFNRSTKKLMLDYAFGFADSVIFHVGSENHRSRKAMTKLGAILIGEETVAYYGEAPKTNVVFRIKKSEWKL